jgi:hypothetical protein
MKLMNGITISEMAEILKLPKATVKMRLLRGGFKPITKEAVYPLEAFEAIKQAAPIGRPPKAKPDET